MEADQAYDQQKEAQDQEYWNDGRALTTIEKEMLLKLNASMPKQLAACIKNKGGITKYQNSFHLVEKMKNSDNWLSSYTGLNYPG